MNLLRKIIKGLIFRIESNLLAVFSIFDYIRSNNHVYENPSIGAFYQCYKQPKSLIATLASFRKIYPTSSIHLFCDYGGYDMSHIASHFNCEYENIPSKTGNGTTLYFLTKEQVMLYLKRLVFSAQNSREDFIMILEDDTRVYSKIRKLKFDWNCIKSDHHYSGKKLTSLLRTRNNSIPKYISNMYFAGCGGAMINRDFLVDNFSDEKKIDITIDELSPYIQKQWNGALPQDAILTALILYFGGTVGAYPGFAEDGAIGFTEISRWKYKFRPFLGRIDIVHNDKSLYNLPLSEDENKIFLGK